MNRGILDDSDSKRVENELPNLSKLMNMLRASPDGLALACPDTSKLPTALICFKDAVDVLEEARYALSEVYAHQIWYLEKAEPPNSKAAVSFCRFYANDVSFRLYSAAEHLANGIIMMLDITDAELECSKSKRTSQQSIIGNYLRKEKPGHPITEAIIRLADSKEWQETMIYRGKLVHEQPPTVEGLGVVYKRRQRWELSADGERYTMGLKGDEPEFTIDKLVAFIKLSMFQFTDTLTKVVNLYIQTWHDISKESGDFIINWDTI
jgi:hypothetical protein